MAKSVLVVDDSPSMRQLVRVALGRFSDVTVVEAEDGVSALQKLGAVRFDLLIVDLNMPILDGGRLIEKVRSDPSHADLPILVVTTESAEDEKQRTLARGATAYLTKPVQAEALVVKVQTLLG